MQIKMIITKDTVTPKLKQLPNDLDIGIRQTLLDVSEFILDRARFYSTEITGAYSQGAVSGKLSSSFGRSVGKRVATVFQKPSMTTKRGYNYGSLQDRGVGASSFVGWSPIYAKGRWYMVRTQPGERSHPGFRGKRFMQRAARDGRAYAGRSLSDNIKVALRR